MGDLRGQAEQFEPRRWLIWSMSKRCWWRAQECGYTDDVREAGRYTDAEALAVVARMNYAPTTGAAGRDGLGDPVQIVPVNERWLAEPIIV